MNKNYVNKIDLQSGMITNTVLFTTGDLNSAVLTFMLTNGGQAVSLFSDTYVVLNMLMPDGSDTSIRGKIKGQMVHFEIPGFPSDGTVAFDISIIENESTITSPKERFQVNKSVELNGITSSVEYPILIDMIVRMEELIDFVNSGDGGIKDAEAIIILLNAIKADVETLKAVDSTLNIKITDLENSINSIESLVNDQNTNIADLGNELIALNNMLSFKADADKVYSKTETYDRSTVNSLLNNKANKSEVYAKSEADAINILQTNAILEVKDVADRNREDITTIDEDLSDVHNVLLSQQKRITHLEAFKPTVESTVNYVDSIRRKNQFDYSARAPFASNCAPADNGKANTAKWINIDGYIQWFVSCNFIAYNKIGTITMNLPVVPSMSHQIAFVPVPCTIYKDGNLITNMTGGANADGTVVFNPPPGGWGDVNAIRIDFNYEV